MMMIQRHGVHIEQRKLTVMGEARVVWVRWCPSPSIVPLCTTYVVVPPCVRI